MNNKHQENEASRGPLIFTMPASCFLVALNLDWLDGPDRTTFPPKPTVGTVWQLASEPRRISRAGF
jgi:hypothetical protein